MNFFGISLCLILLGNSDSTSFDLETAIEKALPHSTLEIPNGTYHGNFKVSKPLTLRGIGNVVLDGDSTGTVLRLEAPDIRLENLQIQNSGSILGAENSGIIAENSPGIVISNVTLRNTLFGVELLNCPNAQLLDSDIRGYSYDVGRRGDGLKIWYSPNVIIRHNRIQTSRDVLVWYSNGSLLSQNSIHHIRYGIHYMYSHGGIAEQNTIENNSVGIYDMYSNDLTVRENRLVSNRGPSGYGIAVKESDRFKLLANQILANRIGVQLDNSPLSAPTKPEDQALITVNRIAYNDIGFAFIGIGEGVYVHHNDFIENWTQVSSKGSRHTDAHWESNYWSDYRGIDPHQTGFGLTPYHTENLADAITNRVEGFKIFNFGPVVLGLEFAERAIPWFTLSSSAVDQQPSMKPIIIEKTTSGTFADRAAFFSVAALLFVAMFLMRKVASL